MTHYADSDEIELSSLTVAPREILLVSASLRMLAEARTIDEVKDIRDKAEALRMYIKQQGESLEAQNAAAEIKIRAERRAGELLIGMKLRDGGDAMRARSHDVTELPPSLEEIGIGKMQSSRWQQIAGIAEDVLSRHIEETNGHGKELTTASVLRLIPKPDLGEPPPWTLDEAVDHLRVKLYEISRRWPEEHLEVMGHQLRDLGEELIESGELPH